MLIAMLFGLSIGLHAGHIILPLVVNYSYRIIMMKCFAPCGRDEGNRPKTLVVNPVSNYMYVQMQTNIGRRVNSDGYRKLPQVTAS